MIPAEKTLFIEVGDDGYIHVKPSGSVETHEWVQAVSNWTTQNVAAIRKRDLDLLPQDFDGRSSWLRDVWKKNGHLVQVSSGVRELLQASRKGETDFLSLLTLDPERHKGLGIDTRGLKKTLTPEQGENVLCLLEMRNGANFSVPGAGKTLTQLALWSVLNDRKEVGKLLVACPISSFSSWILECAESFSPPFNLAVFNGGPVGAEVEVLIVNYEQLENNSKLQYLSSWAATNNALFVIDEAHRIKAGGRSVRWRACKAIGNSSSRVDLLTGTPMPQGPEDLSSLFGVAWGSLSRKTLNPSTLTQIQRRTAFVRTTKAELNLPDLTIQTIASPTSSLQSEILAALRSKYSGVFQLSISESETYAKRGKAVMTMLAAATNPGLLVSRDFREVEMGFTWPPREIALDSRLRTLVEDYLNFEVPWKFRHIAAQVEANSKLGRKTLIWTSFVGNIAAVKKLLSKFNPAVVYGAVETSERDSEISRFRKSADCSVLITNPQTLGEGISLHMECHDAIYLDRTYNAGLYLQSLDRIHRLGLPQDVDTRIQILVSTDTIDERVSRRLEQKIRKLSSFLQDPGLSEVSIPGADELSPEDVFGITEADLKDVYSYMVTPD